MASKTKYNDSSIYVKLPSSMKAELEKAAAKETITVSLLVRRLILDYLRKKSENPY